MGILGSAPCWPHGSWRTRAPVCTARSRRAGVAEEDRSRILAGAISQPRAGRLAGDQLHADVAPAAGIVASRSVCRLPCLAWLALMSPRSLPTGPTSLREHPCAGGACRRRGHVIEDVIVDLVAGLPLCPRPALRVLSSYSSSDRTGDLSVAAAAADPQAVTSCAVRRRAAAAPQGAPWPGPRIVSREVIRGRADSRLAPHSWLVPCAPGARPRPAALQVQRGRDRSRRWLAAAQDEEQLMDWPASRPGDRRHGQLRGTACSCAVPARGVGAGSRWL